MNYEKLINGVNIEGIKNAQSSWDGIIKTLDTCNVPIHEQNEIMAMVQAFGGYLLDGALAKSKD